MNQKIDRKFCVAPMIDWTDRFERYFLRLISKHAVLFTEMITAPAIIHGKRERLLGFDESEHTVVLQLGGSDPDQLNLAVEIAETWGYDEYNLNLGCPSDRVQAGKFGACLMAEPQLVAECLSAMQSATDKPVTAKTRIGIDEQDSYEFLHAFVAAMEKVGVDTFYIHARKAWLKGLSPKQNREIPPLNYAAVEQLIEDFPNSQFILNGGIQTWEEVESHLTWCHGVMLGRAVYQAPYMLAELDARLYGDDEPVKSRAQVVEAMLPFIEGELNEGVRLQSIVRHMLGLYSGQLGAKRWRRYLSENAHKKDAGIEVLLDALALMNELGV